MFSIIIGTRVKLNRVNPSPAVLRSEILRAAFNTSKVSTSCIKQLKPSHSSCGNVNCTNDGPRHNFYIKK